MKLFNAAITVSALVAAAGAVESSYIYGYLGEAVHGSKPPLAPLPEDGGPRLVAYGCEGASGPLWVREESDLPGRCKEIIGEVPG